jgi:hypothetical protein
MKISTVTGGDPAEETKNGCIYIYMKAGEHWTQTKEECLSEMGKY